MIVSSCLRGRVASCCRKEGSMQKKKKKKKKRGWEKRKTMKSTRDTETLNRYRTVYGYVFSFFSYFSTLHVYLMDAAL